MVEKKPWTKEKKTLMDLTSQLSDRDNKEAHSISGSNYNGDTVEEYKETGMVREPYCLGIVAGLSDRAGSELGI